MAKLRIVRYVLPNGKRVPKGTANATKKVAYTQKFYAIFWQDKRRLRIPLAVDPPEARRRMRELERNLWRLKLGIVDVHADQKRKPITEHITDYLADVRNNGRSERHAHDIDRLLAAVVKTQRLRTLGDLTLPKIDDFLSKLAANNRSPRTRNSYRQALLAFANWLVKKSDCPATHSRMSAVPRQKKRTYAGH